jgi:membrane-associated phospholipid phosphatase
MTHRRHSRKPGLLAAMCCATTMLATGTYATAQTIPSQPQPVATPSTSAPTSMPSVIGEAVTDFRHIPSWTNLAIFAAGGLSAALEHPHDMAVSQALSGSQRLGSLFRVGDTVGGAKTQLAAALGTYAIGQISGQRKVAIVGADLIQSQILAQTMTAAIKMGVGRTRPDGTQYSFPSGHSSVTFATATVLQRDLGWKVGIPAYGLATYVAASRIQDKRHFLSDVTFGAAIGVVAGRSVTVGSGHAKFAVAPSAAPGGGGISFTWLGSSR